ncbi:MAG: HEPN domain-containing protein [Prevotella sp.]|nr:HEPN domain-containing protein [Prevotella sp.]MBP3842136.1 HEPN domain-containing protein [Prevotella sp.]
MSLNHEERAAVVSYRIEKAARAIEQAKHNLPMEYWELIANRMYYAAYYAVSALLIANGYSAKTHETILRLFGLHFIQTEILPKDYGKLYNKLFTLRLKGDYNDRYNLTLEEVLPLVEPTEQLIREVSRMAMHNLNEQE